MSVSHGVTVSINPVSGGFSGTEMTDRRTVSKESFWLWSEVRARSNSFPLCSNARTNGPAA
ncbi:MAG: hypothetical protein M3443_06980 [Actinomycetota bacterium]|nr:hypothetical protein [Actinomycetota bacterium]